MFEDNKFLTTQNFDVEEREIEESEECDEKTGVARFFDAKAKTLHMTQRKNYRMIGNYILGEILSRGEKSKVKLGFHQAEQQKVALKIMFDDGNGIVADYKKQLKRDWNIIKQFKHPNVIQLIGFYEEAEYPEADGTKRPCLVKVLEFAPGGELFDFLMFTGRFSDEVTRTYCRQLLSGLEAIHDLGITHRDLQPENLLMDGDFNLKIADFTTKFETYGGPQKTKNTPCGIKATLAPELSKGKMFTPKCSLFTAGIIIFTLYAGFSPFQNTTDKDSQWNKLSKAWIYFETAKTQNQTEKLKIEKKSKENFESFWKAYEKRSLQFQDDFKDLIVRILHPNPELRYKISDIRSHKWYNGKTLNKNELKKYMEKRIDTVTKEREQKRAEQLNNEKVVSKENYVVRDDMKNEMTKRVKEIDPENVFNKNLDYWTNDNFINTYYTFLTKCPPNEVAFRIERIAIQELLKITFSPSQQLILIRASVIVDDVDDDAIVAVKQFFYGDTDNKSTPKFYDNNNDAIINDINSNNITNNTKTQYVVVFKRLKGEPWSYKHVVEQFYSHKDIMEIMEPMVHVETH